MLIILCTGIILWLVYGVFIQDVPIIAANVVTLLLASVILVLKIKYKSEGSGVRDQGSGNPHASDS
jgi:MtN3 and saliva related transmembrane protein